MGKLVRIKEASKLSGFSISSLNRWEHSGEIKPDFISKGFIQLVSSTSYKFF